MGLRFRRSARLGPLRCNVKWRAQRYIAALQQAIQIAHGPGALP